MISFNGPEVKLREYRGGLEMSDWIDINDKAPEYGQKLGAVKTGSLEATFNMNAVAKWIGMGYCNIYRSVEGDFICSLNDVTHWKPL